MCSSAQGEIHNLAMQDFSLLYIWIVQPHRKSVTICVNVPSFGHLGWSPTAVLGQLTTMSSHRARSKLVCHAELDFVVRHQAEEDSD